MRRTPTAAVLAFGILSSPAAFSHISYINRDFGSFNDNAGATRRIENRIIEGSSGWIDGTDADWGNSHDLAPFRFTLSAPATVLIYFENKAVPPSSSNPFPAAIVPGFSIYRGIAHLPPSPPDHDESPGSVNLREQDSGNNETEGSFRAMSDWRITNEDNEPPTVFTYIGHAYDGAQDYGYGLIPGGDGLEDNRVSGIFRLAAGEYSIFVGGADYDAENGINRVNGRLTIVPIPGSAMLMISGFGAVATAIKRRRKTI